MSQIIDLRCDSNPSRMFGRLLTQGEKLVVTDTNLMEFQCKDCRASREKDDGTRPRYVLHRFDASGSLVETEVVW